MKASIAFLPLVVLLSQPAFADRLWEHTIHQGRDPFTLPQTSLECVNWWHSPLGDQCIGHALQCKFMQTRVTLHVDGPQNLLQVVRDCASEAAVAGALSGVAAAYPLGPSAWIAAFDTFSRTFRECIYNRMPQALTPQLENPASWDNNWGPC